MSKTSKASIGNDPIYDARKLGRGRMVALGLQHMFAMFGATVLVPMLTGMSISTTLLFAGIGTLLFHLITGGKVPAFLGSSFAFLGGYGIIAPLAGKDGMTNQQLIPYACLGVACAGLVYLILAALFRLIGVSKVMRFFPPVVTGPIIICVGLQLAGSAVSNCQTNWLIAVVALAIVIIFNIWGKGMAKIVPIVLGVVGAYVVAACLDGTSALFPNLSEAVPAIFGQKNLNFTPVIEVCRNIGDGKLWGNLVSLPIDKDMTIFGGIDWSNRSLILNSILTITPIALATMMEHIGDVSAIGSTCGKNFVSEPGLHRTLTGDGLATTLASLFGAPANTTYGENTGVLALTRVYDPRVIRIAAFFAVGISFFPIVAAVIETIPTAVIGGISFVLYGMIAAIGVRNVVENQVDFTKSRNLIIAAVIMVSTLGINSIGKLEFTIKGVTIGLSGLAVASLLGIFLNAILPGKDYKFSAEEPRDTGVNFAVGANSERMGEKVPVAVTVEFPQADEAAIETAIAESQEAAETAAAAQACRIDAEIEKDQTDCT